MSLPMPDEKVALRNYLEQDENVLAIVGTSQHRVVLNIDDVKDDKHWLVLQRAGGSVNREVPMTRPLLYMTSYAERPVEALRLMSAACHALGVFDPAVNPQIRDIHVTITDIEADAGWTEGIDDQVPGVNRRVPYVMQPLRLTVFREVLSS